MKSLKNEIQSAFFAIIALFALLIALFGYYEFKHNMIQRAQRQVLADLKIARWAYDSEKERIRFAFNLVDPNDDLGELKKKIGLDFLYVIKYEDRLKTKSDLVLRAFDGNPAAGTKIIGAEELKNMGPEIHKRSSINVVSTPKARPAKNKVLEDAMAVGFAKPLYGENGKVKSVMHGGKIINRDSDLVDKIRDFAFENKLYNKKPIGTVTIFLDDVRIATNVLNSKGDRAIGTRVSESVYKKVVEGGRPWVDRAFVVTDWYLTAYEPIKNINGRTIGILYVGTLEKPFLDIQRNVFFVFLAIVFLASGLAAVLSVILARRITYPLTKFAEATKRVSEGDMDFRIKNLDAKVSELFVLTGSFNDMADRLRDREKSYLDLIGFVAHELKAILASTIMNAYTVRDGYLGMVNFKQRKALDSVARNLDYFSATVKNFLELSRIEKRELNIRKTEFLLKEDIFDMAVDLFLKQAEGKHKVIKNLVPAGIKIKADRDLLQIAANNLIGNAVKYGSENGEIMISLLETGGAIRVEVYNDGDVIPKAENDRLFKKFSRLDMPQAKRASGTGLGLFITREIIEKHGGKIWVEAREKGNAFIFEIDKEG